MDQSKLVATKEGLSKFQMLLNNVDAIESWRIERISTQWKFYKLTNVNCFAASLKKFLVGFAKALCQNRSPKAVQSIVYFLNTSPENYRANFVSSDLWFSICTTGKG